MSGCFGNIDPRVQAILDNPTKENPMTNTEVIHEGISALQELCGTNAQKSGWHRDRPVHGEWTAADGFVHHFNEEPEQYEARLRNWQGMKLMLMVSELSEGTEELRSGHAANETYYPLPPVPASLAAEIGNYERAAEIHAEYLAKKGFPLKPEGMPSELADNVIRVLDFCFTEEIDLASMILEKLEYNQTRGQRHGGKTV